MSDPHDPADGPQGSPGPAAPPAAHSFTDPPYEDPTEAEAAAEGGAPLDDVVGALTGALQGEEGEETITIPVPGRPGVRLVQSTSVTGRQLEAWRKQSKVRGAVDPIKFAGLIMAHTSVGIERGDEPVLDPTTGERATLRAPWFHGLYQAPGSIEAVRRLFAKDGNLNAAGTEVLMAAGWGSELAEDPT